MKNNVNTVNKKGRKKVVIALCAVGLLLISVFAAAAIYIDSKLDLINYEYLDDEWIAASDSDFTDSSDEFGKIDANAEVLLPDEAIYKDKNVFNILLLGTDERSKKFSTNARSDAMLILSINKKNDTIKLVSLERGMSVKMPNGKVDFLTHSFRYGGPKWVLECVRSHFKLDVDKYVRVNFKVFEDLINAVGGVDINLTSLEAKALNQEVDTNTEKLSRWIYAGENHLNGYEALQYCRLRYIDDDFARIKRQRKTIAAIKEQCKDLSLGELNDAADAVLPMVQTNLDKSQIISLMASIPQLLDSEMDDMTIPAEGTFKNLATVDFKANTLILREFLYGVTEEE